MKRIRETKWRPGDGYTTWWDTIEMELVEYNPRWTDEDRKHLVEVGQLQRHQNKFESDSKGIYRTLYGQKDYYILF